MEIVERLLNESENFEMFNYSLSRIIFDNEKEI